jgi:hypothetical protein
VRPLLTGGPEIPFSVKFWSECQALHAGSIFRGEAFMATVALPPFVHEIARNNLPLWKNTLEAARRKAARAVLALLEARFGAVCVDCKSDPWLVEEGIR